LTNITVTTDADSQLTGAAVELISQPTHTSGDPLDDLAILQGNGRYGLDLINTSGIIRPGASAGLLTVDGNYSETTDAQIDIELFSTTEFDVFDITGDASFAGMLNVFLDPGFDLLDAMNFEVIDIGGTSSGRFLGLDQGAVVLSNNGFDLRINYFGGDGNDVVLTTAGFGAAPLPASLLLMLPALVWVGRRSRCWMA